ncbi:conserved hypothetical protein [Hyella patelloides LEGE 07179]|uniref:Prepilin-type N-terminal cleavage/methylation domain-containing protein n=1 Tax=Hyella patelloides LEGE 07179 TaxID=945734 RepID=A0A563VXQ3_9CYAN|nr:type II secretion system protein [Hyella patelloides]VEP16234.1 conserved hypothetical protein [Hyella patelloides LEGE 07179]
MHNKKIKKFLKKTQPNSGFTLTELLTGLIMSIFVTGALGFGLYQIMAATGRENAKTNARQDASRAVEFISDELRRAQSIEVDTSSGNLNTVAGNYTPPTGATARLVLRVPGVDERIIYSVAPPQANSPWQGPLVIYRWGPDLNSSGEYTNTTNPAAWDNDALIDQIDNTNQSTNCGVDGSGNPISVSYQGFFACVVDDDGDRVVEDGTVDTNGDGVVNAQDSDDDADGFGETAQIFVTGGIDADNIAGNDSNYTAETRAVARAKNATVSSAVAGPVSPITMRSLTADYVSNPNFDVYGQPVYDENGNQNYDANGNPRVPQQWTMRMDFDNNPYNSSATNNATQWIHETGRQAQPIDINSGNDLTIYSIPVGQTGALSRGNSPSDGFDEDTSLSDFLDPNPDPNVFSRPGYTVPHTIKFQVSASGRSDDTDFYKTFNGDNSNGNYNNPNVDPSGKVIVLKRGSVLDPNVTAIDTTSDVASAPLYGGYDFDNNPDNGNENQSLGQFLEAKGLATYDSNNETYTINNNLAEDERIIAFETGQDDNGFGTYGTSVNDAHPGFDMQDNVLIMRHDVFEEDHQ